MATKKTFKSNKDKKFENKTNETKKEEYAYIPADINRSIGGKIVKIILVLLMVGIPIGCLIFMLVKTIQG